MSDNIITITDFMDPNLDVYARLTENQLLNRANPKEGMFIAESPKVIERALDAGCEPVSLLMETKHVNGEARGIIERCQNIPVYTASFDLLTKLTGFALTRGTLCAMYRPKPRSVEEICRDARRVAVLEGCGKSNQCRSYIQVSGSTAYGCGAAHSCLQQSFVQACNQG